jgi:hypothetical protein
MAEPYAAGLSGRTPTLAREFRFAASLDVGPPVVPDERDSRERRMEEGEMAQSGSYGRKWKKWLAIYAVVGAIVYLIVYAVFFANGSGSGGLY